MFQGTVLISLGSFFSNQPAPMFGLDISSSSVKLVELGRDKAGNLLLQCCAIEPLERGWITDGNIEKFDEVANALKRLVKKSGTKTKNVAMALPPSAVITKKIIVPAGLRDEELEAQVESEANQYIPFAIDEVNLDYQIIGPSPSVPDEMEVLIAASKKERVEDRVAVADAAGLKAVVVDVESLATLSAFELIERQLPDGGENQVIALIDAGANVMTLTVLRNGQQIYAREQAFGGGQLTQDITRHYGMTHEDAEAAKRAGSLPEGYEAELLNPFMENLALEVSRALQFFFTSTQYNQVDHIVLAGGCAVIPGIDEVVATRTQVNTLIANPFANMIVSDRVRAKSLQSDSSSLMVACGLALRRFDPL